MFNTVQKVFELKVLAYKKKLLCEGKVPNFFFNKKKKKKNYKTCSYAHLVSVTFFLSDYKEFHSVELIYSSIRRQKLSFVIIHNSNIWELFLFPVCGENPDISR